MVQETDNQDDGSDGSTTPVVDDRPFDDHTMKLDRSIVEGNLSAPSHFGRYEVERRIGIGGFASVFAARDPQLDAPVAIKVLAENHSADVEVRKRFVAEARVARRLGGDRLIGVFDVGETDDGRPFVVMELATGGTLRARLARIGRPSKASLARLITELGECMAAIHDKGVVHRDIKPSNLLLKRNGPALDSKPTELIEDDEQIVLADFGLARDISAGASAVTVGGGTAGYMAPEQADPNGGADHRADIFAATVVVAELTTGRHPERLDLSTARISPAMREALEAGMAIDREERPESAEAWVALLLGASGDVAPTQLLTNDDPAATARIDATAVQAPYPYQAADNAYPDTPDFDKPDRQAATVHMDPAAVGLDPLRGQPPRVEEPDRDAALSDLDAGFDEPSGASAGSQRRPLMDEDDRPEARPRMFVRPPVDTEPPPPPPSIPLSSRIQRPPPNARPPQRHEAADGTIDRAQPPASSAAAAAATPVRPQAQPQPQPQPQPPTAPIDRLRSLTDRASGVRNQARSQPQPQTPEAERVESQPPPPNAPRPQPETINVPRQETTPARQAPALDRPSAEAKPLAPGHRDQRPSPPLAPPNQPVPGPIANRPAPPRAQVPVGPRGGAVAEANPPPSRQETKAQQKARQQAEKAERKAWRRRLRRRRRRRISNFIRALIRGALAFLIVIIGGTIFVAASTGTSLEIVADAYPNRVAAVNIAAVVALLVGLKFFPWPRRLDPDG